MNGQQGYQTCDSSGHEFSVCSCGAADAATDGTTAHADAAPNCGDGIVAAGESCLRLASQPLSASSYVVSIDSGDFNGDGARDLVIANTMGVVVFIATSPGQFPQTGSAIALTDAASVRSADIDGDGHLDLVVGRQLSTNDVTVLWGDGTGGFPTQTHVPNTFSPTVSYVVVGDIDNDGHLDIVGGVSSGTAREVVVHNDGNRTFTASGTPALPSNSQGGPIALGDFNHDGFLDIVTGTTDANDTATTFVLTNNKTGGFGTPVASTSISCPGPYTVDCAVDGVAAGRLNADAYDDIVLAMEGAVPKGIAVELSSGQPGIFSLPTFYDPQQMNAGLATAKDVNGDGVVDVVVTLFQSDSLLILLNVGDGTFTVQPALSTSPLGRGPVETVVADLNNDGEPDIATANETTSNVSLFLSSP